MNVLPMLYLRYGNVEIKKQISDDIKQFSYEICQKHKAVIRYMETDKDHIHYMIETEPTVSEEMLRKYIENQG